MVFISGFPLITQNGDIDSTEISNGLEVARLFDRARMVFLQIKCYVGQSISLKSRRIAIGQFHREQTFGLSYLRATVRRVALSRRYPCA